MVSSWGGLRTILSGERPKGAAAAECAGNSGHAVGGPRSSTASYHEYRVSRPVESPEVLDDLVRRIAERFSPDRIILFGSRARGDAAPDSDIDLLVLFPEVADPNRRAAEVYAALVDFPRPMDIVVSTSSRFERYRNVVNTVYWPASREGKVLYERAA